MSVVGIQHNDLHDKNILVFHDRKMLNPDPRIVITDFGIGDSYQESVPSRYKDDYSQLALICHNLLETIEESTLDDGLDRLFYDTLIEDFIPKKILETNPTVDTFVRNPRELLEILEQIHEKFDSFPAPVTTLTNPFDYLRCEQIGNSFELLQKLYSKNFPGYSDLLRRNNTVITGPRGCGKTTIFRNLSLKTQILGNRIKNIKDYPENHIGIYYHCNDLYYAFPYLKEINDEERRGIIHYFNLSIFYETLALLETSKVLSDGSLNQKTVNEIQQFVKKFFPDYQSPPQGTNVIRFIMSFVLKEKRTVRSWFDEPEKIEKPKFLPLDFIKNLTTFLQEEVSWIKGKVIYYFLDDYSLPNISKVIQESINDSIFVTSTESEFFFKISTESLVTFHPYSSKPKLLEERREFVVVDLGYFFHHNDDKVKLFLYEVINNRLKLTNDIDNSYHNIDTVLGPSHYKDYIDLANEIRSSKTGSGRKTVFYYGNNILVRLCSGDVAQILDIIKNMFELSGGLDKFTEPNGVTLPLSKRIQNQAIQEGSKEFLNKIENAPKNGPLLREIAIAFGEVAHWYLMNRTSKNEDKYPPWQAYRIELRSPPELNTENLETYNELLKYGVFFRDVRGKTQRGFVAPRLYLRKLLLPTFLLTPSKRDNIGLNQNEFLELLSNPKQFKKNMCAKKPRRKKFQHDKNQKDLIETG